MILRNQIFDGFITFEFQGHKGQKGRYRYSKVQLVKMQAKNVKISLFTFMRVPQIQNWIPSSEMVISESEMFLGSQKIYDN